MKYKVSIIAAIFILIPLKNLFPQDVNINYYLKKIENGKKQEVIKNLPELKKQHPGSASVMYLDALLTEDGTEAVHKYLDFYKKYPESEYADDALFRVYAYYYAGGSYFAAKEYLKRLKRKYPASPYIKLAESSIPVKDEPGAVPDIEKISETAERKSIPEQKKIKDDFNFTIQAGAFTNPDNASKLHKDFLISGYFSEIKEKTVAGAPFKVVYVGKFKTEKEASEELKIINEKYRLSGRVISANQ
jgi:cell division septation protein DedD